MPRRAGPAPLSDQDARDRIVRHFDRNMLVEAGAGSGKTDSLARRMAAGIAAGVYQVEGMAAVTFTRKAAAELRGRFQLELEGRLGTETDAARRQRIEQALAHLERLVAGTIHAFCARLIRERPVEAGVAPGFTELDELEDAETRMRAWRDFLARERARGSPLLRALDEVGIRPQDLDDGFKDVCTFSDVDFPPGVAGPPDHRPAWEATQRFWAALEPCLPAPIPRETTCGVQLAARTLRGRLRVVGGGPRPADVADIMKMWDGPRVAPSWWGRTPRERQALIPKVRRLVAEFGAATVRPFLAAWRQHCYRVVMSLLVEGRTFAAEARRRAVALNYGDLLEVAAGLLREEPTVRSALQQKYRWLFVDEFQDTNPLQAEVILLLAAAPGGERDWRRARPRPGALFVVGDPKQSIYRFTGADIETYGRVREIVERTGGEVVELTASFRAEPRLCAWANRVFATPTFFPAEATRHQPAFHGLAPVRERGHGRHTGLRTLTIPGDVPAREASAEDARLIARCIRAEVDAGRRRWGDFLILTRKKANLPLYTAALDALHIPAAVSGSVAFTRSREVAILATLLRVLADPDDGVALVGVLRGPLFGLSDVELFRHRQAGFGFMLTAPLPEDATGAVVEAIGQLRAMYHWTRTVPLAAAVERILEATGLLARAAAATPGGGEAGGLLHALDRVRQIAESGGSLAAAAAALEQDLEMTEVESIPLEPGRRDVVRVMNLHKAKGLEAPVVFLADPLAGVKPRAHIRVSRDGARPVGYLQLRRGQWGRDVFAEPAGWDEHEAAELDYVGAEEKRLLYVAATRARDVLVISQYAGASGRAERPWEVFAPFLDDSRPLIVPATVRLQPRALGDVTPDARQAGEADRQARGEQIRRPSSQVESVTATAHRAGPYGHPLQADRIREPDTGIAWGRLIHALLEWALRGPRRRRADLERLANWLTLANPPLHRVVPEALDTVERVMASDLWQRALAAAECHVEVPFAVKLNGEAGPARLLHGVIDLAFKTAQGWELVDYKTDAAGAEDLGARYGDQVRQYARHWARLTEAPLQRGAVFAVREGQLSGNLLDAVERRET